MRKRVAGAGVLVAIGIGIWLSNLRGPGPGGEGTGLGPAENVRVSADSSPVSITESASDATTEEELAGGQSAGAVPTILIDDRQYLLQTGSGGEESFRPVEIEEIVRLVKQVQPGEDGIRLHLKRRPTSRSTTESALQTALREAGIPESQVLNYPGLVE